MAKNLYIEPLAMPLYLMAKPIGAVCNLNCSYCYYLEKEKLYPNRKHYQMSDELLETFTRNYIQCQPTPNVLFTWHGGETLLRNPDFYRKAIMYQQKYGRGRNIENSLQTNGTLVNDEWCRFFKDNNFLIGISIDGPEHCHDIYRKNKGGKGTFKQVMRAIELFQKHDVQFNTLSVINDYNVQFPLEVYHFFKEIGSQYMQFSPIVERLSDERPDNLTLLAPEDRIVGDLAPWTVDPMLFGQFYIDIFDEWVRQDVGRFYVQLFDAALAGYVGEQPGVCVFAQTCGHAACIEFNGDVYGCDHFVFPEFKLGNIKQTSFMEMMMNPKQVQFGQDKRDKLPTQCKECKFLKLCNGECPKNRIDADKYGEEGLNYLCKGYYKFFEHTEKHWAYMANELANKRAPANIMRHFK